VLDKQNLFCYAGDQHKSKSHAIKGLRRCYNDRSLLI